MQIIIIISLAKVILTYLSVVFSGGYIAEAQLTVTPVNTVSRAGTRVQLQCTTDAGLSGRIGWYRDPGNDEIVDDCQPESSFPQYNVVKTSVGQCDLVISNAQLELAATYTCSEGANTAPATLTVIGELCV